MNKRIDAQSNIGGMTVSRMMLDFTTEFSEVYPSHILMGHGVGPMQSFLGYLIAEGHITLNLKDDPVHSLAKTLGSTITGETK
tara:strand:- start:186 stop:434 length:249 start_codon:yes stop_codon:yes gene_type:complete